MTESQLNQIFNELRTIKKEVRELSDKVGLLPDSSLAAILALTETIDERSKGSLTGA